jgi:hypothetical protein
MTTESMTAAARRAPEAAAATATAAAGLCPEVRREADPRPAPLWLRPAYSLTHAGQGLAVAVRVSARSGA